MHLSNKTASNTPSGQFRNLLLRSSFSAYSCTFLCTYTLHLGVFPLCVCVVFGPRREYEPAVCLGSKGGQQHLGCINRSTTSGRREVIISLSTC